MSGSVGKLGNLGPRACELNGQCGGRCAHVWKGIGGSATRNEAARRMLDRGYTLVGIGSDIELIRNGLRENLATVR